MSYFRVLRRWIPILAVVWLWQAPTCFADGDDVTPPPAVQDSGDSARKPADTADTTPKPAEHEFSPASAEKQIVDGMTFADLVAKLGPGSPVAGTDGELRWYFEDDAVLEAQSSANTEVMRFGDGGRMRWITEPRVSFVQRSRQKFTSAVASLRAKPYFHQAFIATIAGLSLVILVIGLRWYSVVRGKRRAVAGRLFHANARIPAMPWSDPGKGGSSAKAIHPDSTPHYPSQKPEQV